MFATILTIIIVLFLVLVVAMIPFAAIKQAKIPKAKCPHCENEVKFYKSPMKCPMCKTKVYKHGDGTYKIKESKRRL